MDPKSKNALQKSNLLSPPVELNADLALFHWSLLLHNYVYKLIPTSTGDDHAPNSPAREEWNKQAPVAVVVRTWERKERGRFLTRVFTGVTGNRWSDVMYFCPVPLMGTKVAFDNLVFRGRFITGHTCQTNWEVVHWSRSSSWVLT